MAKPKMEAFLCEKNAYGYWVCSAMMYGRRIHRVYVGYSKKEATRDFKRNPPE